ncbi:MAG: hypothetical protein AAF799_26240 [Myxococcota bacterium]
MSKNLASTFALSAAALFLSACSKDPAPTTNPDAAAPPAATDADAAAGDAVADAEDGAAEVKCFGVNECKGESACDVAGSHECGGQNDCKGKGWILISQADCEGKGGEIL